MPHLSRNRLQSRAMIRGDTCSAVIRLPRFEAAFFRVWSPSAVSWTGARPQTTFTRLGQALQKVQHGSLPSGDIPRAATCGDAKPKVRTELACVLCLFPARETPPSQPETGQFRRPRRYQMQIKRQPAARGLGEIRRLWRCKLGLVRQMLACSRAAHSCPQTIDL